MMHTDLVQHPTASALIPVVVQRPTATRPPLDAARCVFASTCTLALGAMDALLLGRQRHAVVRVLSGLIGFWTIQGVLSFATDTANPRHFFTRYFSTGYPSGTFLPGTDAVPGGRRRTRCLEAPRACCQPVNGSTIPQTRTWWYPVPVPGTRRCYPVLAKIPALLQGSLGRALAPGARFFRGDAQ